MACLPSSAILQLVKFYQKRSHRRLYGFIDLVPSVTSEEMQVHCFAIAWSFAGSGLSKHSACLGAWHLLQSSLELVWTSHLAPQIHRSYFMSQEAEPFRPHQLVPLSSALQLVWPRGGITGGWSLLSPVSILVGPAQFCCILYKKPQLFSCKLFPQLQVLSLGSTHFLLLSLRI